MSTPGGTISLAGDLSISRMGYGAMQLAGPGVSGPPADRDAAVAVLREAVDLGITHIDTADFYGPFVTNEIIKEALYPYPSDVHIVTKVGARRGSDGSWIHTLEPAELKAQVHENLGRLGLEALDVVNLRLAVEEGPADPADLDDQVGALAELRDEGLIRNIGISGATDEQVTAAKAIAPIVTVQNHYNVANRNDDPLVDRAAREGIAYVPFFPLGGFSPIQSTTLDSVASALGASAQQVALAWLLQRSPAIAVIPGTSSSAHLRENVAAADLQLDADTVATLDAIGLER
ncbi:oxidoreductase [Spelaeicoccus albus]|uniref:Aryl-alcohol dehydrogenase-like predicted oxidoreductase n=1 Tax=Spelaeicoccus albus TaxID=1280376 RepID=A0A7Z0D232_9MICO|nr:oxidoreductase [Spelaeicoccus albus]NYI67441.1 aryl-alcohol dehydrogenase-like predicted oxidoreductase [Spelaeicoccus albus]